MSLAAVLLFAALSALGALGFQRRGERQYLIPAFVGVIAIALNLRAVPSLEMRSPWIELALTLVVGVLFADIQGLPRPLAVRLHFGLRCREWEFDRQLQIRRSRLDRLLLARGTSRDWAVHRKWQASVHRRGPRLVRDMRSLRAPDQSWAAVRDGYADLYERIILGVGRDELPDDVLTLARGSELQQDVDRLRKQYRDGVPPNMQRKP